MAFIIQTALLIALVAAVAFTSIGTALAKDDDVHRRGHRHRGGEHGARLDRPVIEDTAGRFVARLAPVGFAGSAIIPFETGNVLVPLGPHGFDPQTGLQQSSGLDWRAGSLYFTSLRCSGQAYVPSQSGGGGQRSVVAQLQGSQWTAFVAAAAAPQRLSMQSVRDESGRCRSVGDENQMGLPLPITETVTPMQTSFSLDAYGRAPFYVD